MHSQLAVSTWSLHRSIENGTPLLDIPAQAAAHGIGRLEICHFHFPNTDQGYLADLRGALDEAGVKFFTLLMDTGDITHPDPARREEELALIERWVAVAAECGAERIRVIGGDAPPSPEAVGLSAQGMKRLAQKAADSGVRLVTENWHALLDRPAEVLSLLEQLDGQLGLMLDFGNWKGARKYDDLAQIAPYATSTHAKAHFTAPGVMDREDFTRCLDICRNANISGPHSLIFDGPIEGAQDEWASLDEIQEVVRPYLTTAAA